MVKKQSKIKKVLLIISIIIGIFFVSLVAGFGILYNSYQLDINKLTSVNNGIKVCSSSGSDTTLYNTNRSIVALDSLPEYVKKAFIDTEDKRFYSHSGFDLKRIVKAGFVNLTTKSKSQGASTISQQLIKNALLTNEKTYSRKIKEIILSIKMEKNFSKDEILEMYLNTIYFGSNAYGIENASKMYFNKSSSDLTLNEACCLAGIIKSPNQYSPKTNYDNSIKRKNTVALLMLKANDITKEQYDDVVASEITLSQNSYDTSYEEEAIFEACQLLNITERELINKDYQIVTFKDDNLQKEVIKANKTLDDLDSASIVVNNLGEIKAYYVNSDYNLHNMKRQPASVLKPLAVYLPCITHNILTPASIILDEEINFNGFKPKNADNKFHGYITARQALSESLNIPAVKLLDCVGLKKAKETLSTLGINIDKEDLNLSLALGSISHGVSLLELVNAYSTLSNLGVHYQASFIDKILDKNGNIIYSNEKFNQRLISHDDAFLLTDMLKDTAKTGTSKRLNKLNLPIASKTGTAFNGEHNTDLYNISYTPEYTTLSWVGNVKDNVLDDKYLSSVQPTEVNKQIFKSLYKNKTCPDFVKPDNVLKMPYDVIEATENNRIVSPTTSLDRYIAYDYFKKDFPPPIIIKDEDIKLDVILDKNIAKISFNCTKNNEYSIIKIIKNKEIKLHSVNDYCGEYVLTDENIFNYDEITYKVISNTSEEKKTIRPKDYLINKLNNEFLSSKKKWYV